MDPFEIKCLSAGFLWAISVCFGVILPYFLWKISLQKYYFDVPLSEDETIEQEESPYPPESGNLIATQRGRGGNGSCNGPIRLCRRSTSCLRVRFSSGNILSLVNCLCGGVFLGVSLLDLIPQSGKAFKVFLDSSNIATSYPVAEFAVALGLLLVMLVENVMTELVVPNRNSELAGHEHREGEAPRRSKSSVVQDLHDSIAAYRMFVLVATISLHSIFEGLAIGLQKEISTLLQLLIAISVHKSVLTFGIGLRLFEVLGKLEKSCIAIFCSLTFCSASPLGCFVGAFIATDKFKSSPGALLATAVLQCLASGTFLYVTFVEVIPREFSHDPQEHFEHTEATKSTNSDSEPVFNNQTESSNERQGVDSMQHREMKDVRRKQTGRQSPLLKLLMLILGFALASGLQFL